MDDVECSELCSCGADILALSCHALCVPLAPCRTSLAYYSHAAPAYQAFRGRCLCYSGRFICMRPPPGEYKVRTSQIFLILSQFSLKSVFLSLISLIHSCREEFSCSLATVPRMKHFLDRTQILGFKMLFVHSSNM